MAKIFVTTKKYEAELLVYRVVKDYEADLLYWKTKHDFQAAGDFFWTFVDLHFLATRKIMWTSEASRADLKVFPIRFEHQAQWQRPNKWQGLL